MGAKDPYNIITINLDPQRTLPGQNDAGFINTIFNVFAETTFGDLTFKPAVSSQVNSESAICIQNVQINTFLIHEIKIYISYYTAFCFCTAARELLQPQSHATHYPPSLGPPYYPVASHSRNMSGEQVVCMSVHTQNENNAHVGSNNSTIPTVHSVIV